MSAKRGGQCMAVGRLNEFNSRNRRSTIEQRTNECQWRLNSLINIVYAMDVCTWYRNTCCELTTMVISINGAIDPEKG